jgi:signal transduction histidine kinase/MFS family permease
MSPLLFLQIATCAISFLLGIFAVWKRPHAETAWYFCLFALGTALWSASLAVAMSGWGEPTPWGRLAISFGSFMPAGFFLFLSSFPRRERGFAAKQAAIATITAFCFFFSLSPLVIRETWIVEGSFLYVSVGSGYLMFSAYYLGFLIVALTKCILKYRAENNPKRRDQLRYVTLGFFLFFVPLLISQFILPLLGIFRASSLGPLFALPMLAAITYAIIRHELMDIRVVIQRSLIYSALVIFVSAIYLFLVLLIGFFFKSAGTTTAITSAGITTILGVFGVPIVKQYFRKWSDPIFFKHPYDYAQALHSLSSILYLSLSRDEILSRSSSILSDIFKTKDVHFVLEPAAIDTLTTNDQTLGFKTLSHPIVFEDKAVGILTLGHKRSEESYTTQDLQLISTFTFQAAIALEKARLHQEVHEYSVHLEQLVAERTGEIQKLQEEQQEAMIDISHNLQTPLAVIKGELELLGDSVAEPEKIRRVTASLDRVSAFIRQLLRIAHLEHSSNELEMSPLDIAALIREQLDYFEVMAEDKNVAITSTISECGDIFANKNLIEEVLVNLVANAIRYRSTLRPAVISIALADAGSYVEITVRDNGVGISKEHQAKLFNRFYRPEHDGTPGTGLGLAIVQQIISRHGGSIHVESVLDQGTAFVILLPKKKSVF